MEPTGERRSGRPVTWKDKIGDSMTSVKNLSIESSGAKKKSLL
jgi:hypothetical protein